MIIVDARESDSIDKALRKFKKKFERAGIVKELRSRQHYIKPSVRRRTIKLKAAYRNEKFGQHNQ